MADEWPDPWMDRLRSAIRSALANHQVSDVELDRAAYAIDLARGFGVIEEQPNSLPASQDASERELRQLHDACEKLADLLDNLHRPGVSALFAEGLPVRDFRAKVVEAQEIARHAWGAVRGNGAKGRPRKIAAEQVTLQAAQAYERLTGARPTFSTDPQTSAVTGHWPSFLAAIFGALCIDASVTAQVQRLSRENGAAEGL